VCVIGALPFCVESPRWLASKGRREEVYEVLALLEGRGTTTESEEIRQQGDIILNTAEHERAIEGSWISALKSDELQNFRRLILSGAAGVMHQVRLALCWFNRNILKSLHRLLESTWLCTMRQ